jgi:hypothetical protein
VTDRKSQGKDGHRQTLENIDPTPTIASLHEAAHGIAAVEMAMLAIDLRLGSHLSIRGIPVDGSTGYECPILAGESELQMLQRRMVVILAGPAWEESSAVKQTLSEIFQSQRDDRLAAVAIIRYARKRYRLAGTELRKWLTQAWETAKRILNQNNSAIISVGEHLTGRSSLRDSDLRFIVGFSSVQNTQSSAGS